MTLTQIIFQFDIALIVSEIDSNYECEHLGAICNNLYIIYAIEESVNFLAMDSSGIAKQ